MSSEFEGGEMGCGKGKSLCIFVQCCFRPFLLNFLLHSGQGMRGSGLVEGDEGGQGEHLLQYQWSSIELRV